MPVDKELQYMRRAAIEGARSLKQKMKHMHPSHMMSVRKGVHEGHTIEIKTTYEVRIDGKVTSVPLTVDSLGRVACHAIPNYSFQSAVDLVKQVIAAFPDDFSKKRRKEAHHHGGHS